MIGKQQTLPTNWAMTSLCLAAEINPRLDKSTFAEDVEVSFVPMPAVEAETGKIDVSQIRTFGEVKKGYTPFKKGDVLFAKITPCMENGKMAVVPDLHNNIGFGSTEFHVLRYRQGIDPSFLYYFVSSKGFRFDAEHNMTGAVGQKRVPTIYLESCNIPLPPSNEQLRIVSKLEELFSELDKGIESFKTAREQLTVYRQALLKHAFEGKLTEEWRKNRADELESAETLLEKIKAEREQRDQINFNHRGKLIKARKVEIQEGKKPTNTGDLKKLPTGWTLSPIEQVAEINPRLNKLEIRDDLYVSFVSMSAVGAEDGTIDVSQEREFSEVKKGFTSFQEKDVLFAKITPCMENGKMAVVPMVKNGYGFGSTEFHVLRPEGGINPWYLYFFVSSNIFRGKAMQHMTGGVGQKRVPSRYLAEHQIPLCSPSEQIQIVQQLESRLSVAEKLEQDIEDSLKQAEALRQSLLKESL